MSMTRRAALIAAGLAAIRPAWAQAANVIALGDMAPEGPVIGFTAAITGGGGPVDWRIRADATAAGGKAIAQLSDDRTDNRFPVLLYERASPRDVEVSARFKPVAGRVDRAAGLIVRARDAGNYYVARANALENNVNLYRVVGGRRSRIRGANVPVASGAWQGLRLAAVGPALRVWFNDRLVVDASDGTFADAGRIGLWTKSDSVTLFDSLSWRELSG